MIKQLSQLFIYHTICWAVRFQFTDLFCDDWENIYILCLIIIKSEVWTITHCLGWGHETMMCAVCLSIFLWMCDMAELLRGAFVPWWYLPRIWPSVTAVQHYYHARYPTEDWHICFHWYSFPSKCVWKACFPILLAQGEIPASEYMYPLRCPPPPPPPPPPPHKKKKSKRGWPGSPLQPSEGAFQLTHVSACIIG